MQVSFWWQVACRTDNVGKPSNSFQKPSIAFEKLSSFGAYPYAPNVAKKPQSISSYLPHLAFACLEQSGPRSRHSPAHLLAYTSRRQECLRLPQSPLCQIHVGIGTAFVACATIDRAIESRSIGRAVQVESDYRRLRRSLPWNSVTGTRHFCVLCYTPCAKASSTPSQLLPPPSLHLSRRNLHVY